jgi:hypothetical protein
LTLVGEVRTSNEEGTFVRKLLKVFVDSGASHSFIDARLAADLHLKRRSSASATATLVDGSQVEFGDGLAPVKLQLGHYTSRIKLRTVKMESYDVILGRDWLERHNLKIDWRRGELASATKGNLADFAKVSGPVDEDDNQPGQREEFQPGEEFGEGRASVPGTPTDGG